MTSALLLKFWKPAAAVLLVGLVVYACHARDQALVEKGRAEAQLAALREKTRLDSIVSAEADVVVRVDTVVLTRWLTRYDTLRSTLDIHDTIRVKEFVHTSDANVAQCRATVLSLTTSCARKDTTIADLRAQLALAPHVEQKQEKSRRRRLSLGVTGGYGATYEGGKVHTGPSVTAGGTWTLF